MINSMVHLESNCVVIIVIVVVLELIEVFIN